MHGKFALLGLVGLMLDANTGNGAASAELAFEMVFLAYAALAKVYETAYPDEFEALGPTMRVFLAESFRMAEERLTDGRITPEAFMGAIRRVRTGLDAVESVVLEGPNDRQASTPERSAPTASGAHHWRAPHQMDQRPAQQGHHGDQQHGGGLRQCASRQDSRRDAGGDPEGAS